MNFIQQAYKGRNDWPHYILVILMTFFGWQVLGFLPLLLVAITHAANESELLKAMGNSFMSLGVNKNLFLSMLILMFAFGLWFLYLGVKHVHKRKFITVVTSRSILDWKRVFTAFVSWGIVAGMILFVGIVLSPEDYVWNFKPIPFFTLLAVAFFLLPLQTSFEELLFRGYLMQGIGTAVKNRWLPLIITSVVFGLMHGANPEVQKLGMISMVFYIGTGLFYGIATLMDEGIELALGLHAANNIIAAVIATSDWTALQTDALFIDKSEPSAGFEMFLPVLVLYPLMLLYFSKKYNWSNWQGKIFGEIKEPAKGLDNDDKYNLIDKVY